jgi:hypothetical protein
VVAGTYTAATHAGERYRRPRPARGPNDRLDRQFVHSLVPILVGYTIAHYFSLLVFQGQMGYILGSDPFAMGCDLFGTAIGAHYRHTTPEMAARVTAAVAERLVVVLAIAEAALDQQPW